MVLSSDWMNLHLFCYHICLLRLIRAIYLHLVQYNHILTPTLVHIGKTRFNKWLDLTNVLVLTEEFVKSSLDCKYPVNESATLNWSKSSKISFLLNQWSDFQIFFGSIQLFFQFLIKWAHFETKKNSEWIPHLYEIRLLTICILFWPFTKLQLYILIEKQPSDYLH